jgi:hypothetical protein
MLFDCFVLDTCFAYSFDPEDGGDMFLRNVDEPSPGYAALYRATPYKHRFENLK